MRPALEHAERHAADERRGGRARDERRRHGGDRGRRRARRRAGDAISGDIVVVSCGAANSAKLLLASANDKHPNGLANGSDQVGPQLHVPQQPGRARAVARSQPDRLPEDARAQRLLLRRATTSTTRSGNIQMVGKSQAPMFRGEKPLRDEARAAVDARARSPTTRSTSGSRPRTCRSRRTASRSTATGNVTLSYTATNEEPKKQLYDKLKSMLGHLGHAPGPPAPAPRLPEERDPGRRRARTRPAPAASAPTRPTRCSTRTARPTSSTTSTSSTRASSRASARSTRR